MNAVEARKIAKTGITQNRTNVIRNINRLIEEAAKRHQTNETVVLTARPYNGHVAVKHCHLYQVPVDQESIEIYLNHLRMAGFVVEELFSGYNDSRLHISWEDE